VVYVLVLRCDEERKRNLFEDEAEDYKEEDGKYNPATHTILAQDERIYSVSKLITGRVACNHFLSLWYIHTPRKPKYLARQS